MHSRRDHGWNRREFLRTLSLAGTAGFLGLRPELFAAEPPPETTKITLRRTTVLCHAPVHLAEALLKFEGFTEVHFKETARGEAVPPAEALASGEVQIMMQFAGPLLLRVDAGDPILILSGGHIGCQELFAHESVRSVRDLKGKTVILATTPGAGPHTFLATVLAHVGLDHRKDVKVLWLSIAEGMRAFEERKADAYMGGSGLRPEFRTKWMRRMIVNSTTDRPWSQYFCCMVAGNREWVRKHPIATKRALRAILKSADICALEPQRAARTLVDQGFTTRYAQAVQELRELPYGKWREYDPEDTVRFYSLRLHEAGMIKSNPQKIIAQGTDWRFLRELKKEIKG
ncbi:MAG: ABC transporter substrate-binding protein [Deltaproteobacteria bacterium]|nr:ABC transporter substrate-binding protein [Deltaproteobacteria bacterium]